MVKIVEDIGREVLWVDFEHIRVIFEYIRNAQAEYMKKGLHVEYFSWQKLRNFGAESYTMKVLISLSCVWHVSSFQGLGVINLLCMTKRRIVQKNVQVLTCPEGGAAVRSGMCNRTSSWYVEVPGVWIFLDCPRGIEACGHWAHFEKNRDFRWKTGDWSGGAMADHLAVFLVSLRLD
jgi:hypothetical protein